MGPLPDGKGGKFDRGKGRGDVGEGGPDREEDVRLVGGGPIPQDLPRRGPDEGSTETLPVSAPGFSEALASDDRCVPTWGSPT